MRVYNLAKNFNSSRYWNSLEQARLGGRLSILLLSLVFSFCASWPVFAEGAAAKRLVHYSAELREQFPDVTHISTAQYLAEHPKALLVDVRAESEYEVSHLPGAVNIHLDDEAGLLAFAEAHPEDEMLLYCSVGYRSSIAARFLQTQGHTNVINLEGSIFAWSNQQRPLLNDVGPTRAVHPYNAWWGWRYLEPVDDR